MNAAAGSNVGMKRKRNEDSFYLGNHLAVVADGMGGHVSGDVASKTVVEAIKSFDRSVKPAQLAATLGQAIHAANQSMRQEIEARPALKGMGTTLVGLMWSEGQYAFANVGDSRAYLLRDGKLRQLTDDHVYGRLLANAGRVPNLTERISRFLDGRLDGRSPDLAPLNTRAGDRLLLCSDGLSSYVAATTVADILGVGTPTEAVDRLVAATLDAGAPDNVTVIVLDV